MLLAIPSLAHSNLHSISNAPYIVVFAMTFWVEMPRVVSENLFNNYSVLPLHFSHSYPYLQPFTFFPRFGGFSLFTIFPPGLPAPIRGSGRNFAFAEPNHFPRGGSGVFYSLFSFANQADCAIQLDPFPRARHDIENAEPRDSLFLDVFRFLNFTARIPTPTFLLPPNFCIPHITDFLFVSPTKDLF